MAQPFQELFVTIDERVKLYCFAALIWEMKMSLLLIVLVLVLLFGGGGYYGYSRWR